MHCWFCHGIQTMDNSRICHCHCFMNMVSKNFVQRFGSYYATHTLGLNFTNCHELNLWCLWCHYSWPLPEANSTTVRDLMTPSVNSLPLSVIVCSRFHRREFVHWTWICFSTCANLNICSFNWNLWYMATSKQADIHTHVCNAVTLVWGSLRLAPTICRSPG